MSAVRLTSDLWGLHPQSYDRIHGQTLMALTHLQRRHFKSRRLLGSSHEVLIPYSANNLSPLNPGLPHPIRSAFRLFQPLSGLLLRLRHGLISYHEHSWDLLYRVFPSNAAPHPRQIWPLTASASSSQATTRITKEDCPDTHTQRVYMIERTPIQEAQRPSPFTTSTSVT
jgi:hypothetical protein